jgi:hypothetical protein
VSIFYINRITVPEATVSYCVGDHLKDHILLCLSLSTESEGDLYSRVVPDIGGVVILHIYPAH